MPLLCLGEQGIKPRQFEATAAQLRILNLFTPQFLGRYPNGIVLSELEYMGRTTAAPNNPGPILIPGNRKLTAIMEALTSDFRRWCGPRDYRKCDVLGISGFGDYAELLEVTTSGNARSAIGQIRDKLDTLRSTVNETMSASVWVDWQPSLWRPTTAWEMVFPLPATRRGEIRYVCFEPTLRLNAPPGVILYEIHSFSRFDPVPVPIDLPESARRSVREDYKTRRMSTPTEEAWARQVLNDNPNLGPALKIALVGAGVVMTAVTLLALIDPVPGDEVAAGSATLALFRAAAAF